MERRYGKKRSRRKKLEVARLTCVTKVGSNYVGLRFVDAKYNSTVRVHVEDFDDVCAFESNPSVFIRSMVTRHQEDARQLLAEVQRVTAQLGIRPHGLLEEQTSADSTSRALVVAHGTDNIHAHKDALVKAKETTLPDLFKQIEEAHEQVAIWMKAELLPMKVQANQMRGAIDVIEDRIFTVELYAGLVEELVKVRDGKPADVMTKVSLYQRRHYMDEECLARYEHGGMTFENIEDFDEWIARPDNFKRLLPSERCIVAFRVRRYSKDRGPVRSFGQLLQFWYEEQADRRTYLYLRNGEQLWRMSTGIDFGRRLFPDIEHSVLLGSRDKLYAREFAGKINEVVSERQYETLAWPKLPGIQSTGKLDRGTYFLATHEEGTKILTDWCEAAARFVFCRRVPSNEKYPPEVAAVASLMNWTLPDLPCVEAAVWLTTDNPDRHLDWRTKLRRDTGWDPTNRDAVKELWISTVQDVRSHFMG